MKRIARFALFLLVGVPLWSLARYVIPMDAIGGAFHTTQPGNVHAYASSPVRLSVSGNRGAKLREYYVSTDGNDRIGNGSREKPWATLNHADAMIGPGAVVHVAPGTYTTPVSLSKSGTADQHIVFTPDTRWAAKFVFTPSAPSDNCFRGSGSYVDYIGFDVTENPLLGSGCRMGMYLTGGHITVRNNYVHDLNRNVYISTCNGKWGGGGIVVSSQATSPLADTATIDSNIVDNIGGEAPYFGQHSCHFIHNFYLSMSNLTVTNNISLRAEGQCYSFGGHAEAGQLVGNAVVVNNAAINCGQAGFYMKSELPDAQDLAYNNIVDQRAAGTLGFIATYTLAFSTVISNNLVYMPAGGVAYKNCDTGTRCTVLNAISGDPRFQNYTGDSRGNYHLTNVSPAIGSGLVAREISTDFDGVPRSLNKRCDIGPYAYTAAENY
jgi:hypothetical protein